MTSKKIFGVLLLAALAGSTLPVYASDMGDCSCDSLESYSETYTYEYSDEIVITQSEITPVQQSISYAVPHTTTYDAIVPVAHGIPVAHPVTVAYGIDVAHPVTVAHAVTIATASSDYVGHAVDVAHAVTIGTITEVAHAVDIGTPASYAYPVTIGTPVAIGTPLKIGK